MWQWAVAAGVLALNLWAILRPGLFRRVPAPLMVGLHAITVVLAVWLVSTSVLQALIMVCAAALLLVLAGRNRVK